MKQYSFPLPTPKGSSRKGIYIVEFDQDEELRIDCSAGISFDNNFLENETFLDRFACCVVKKSVYQKFKVNVRLRDNQELKTFVIDQGIIPPWSEVAKVPKSKFDEFGEDFLSNVDFRRAFCRLVSKENNNVHISVYIESQDFNSNLFLMRKYVLLSPDNPVTVKQGCIALLQDSNKVIANGNSYIKHFIIAKTTDVELTSSDVTSIFIIRLDDSLSEI